MAADHDLRASYESVRQRVAAAAQRSGRTAKDVLLVAVTKYADPDQIRELVAMGHQDFGENRVQNLLHRAAMVDEYMARARQLGPVETIPTPENLPDEVRWHIIGTLQRNKVKKAVEVGRLIHSVDSLRLAEEIHAVAVKRDKPIDVLIQVNMSHERQKGGIAAPAVRAFAEQIDTMVNVRLRGLMTMAAYSDNPEDSRDTFARTRDLFEDVQKSGVGEGRFNILSMGMSGDFEVAIEEGANLVRVGSAIFGERDLADEEHEMDEEETEASAQA